MPPGVNSSGCLLTNVNGMGEHSSLRRRLRQPANCAMYAVRRTRKSAIYPYDNGNVRLVIRCMIGMRTPHTISKKWPSKSQHPSTAGTAGLAWSTSDRLIRLPKNPPSFRWWECSIVGPMPIASAFSDAHSAIIRSASRTFIFTPASSSYSGPYRIF